MLRLIELAPTPQASSDEQEMVPHLASALLSILELMPRPQQRLLDGRAERLSIQESKLIMQQGVERLKQYSSSAPRRGRTEGSTSTASDVVAGCLDPHWQ
jgi:hypothetical protein